MALRAPSLCDQEALLLRAHCGRVCFAVVWVCPTGLSAGVEISGDLSLCEGKQYLRMGEDP